MSVPVGDHRELPDLICAPRPGICGGVSSGVGIAPCPCGILIVDQVCGDFTRRVGRDGDGDCHLLSGGGPLEVASGKAGGGGLGGRGASASCAGQVHIRLVLGHAEDLSVTTRVRVRSLHAEAPSTDLLQRKLPQRPHEPPSISASGLCAVLLGLHAGVGLRACPT